MLFWAVLFGYLQAYTNPPLLATILLLLPFLALAWTLSLISRETVWEPDDSCIRKTFGRKTTASTAWKDVGELFVKAGPRATNASMLVVGRDGSRKMEIVAGAGLDLPGLRILYQSACAYLRVHRVEGKNPFGWPNTLPLAGTVETRSVKPNWLAHVGVEGVQVRDGRSLHDDGSSNPIQGIALHPRLMGAIWSVSRKTAGNPRLTRRSEE